MRIGQGSGRDRQLKYDLSTMDYFDMVERGWTPIWRRSTAIPFLYDLLQIENAVISYDVWGMPQDLLIGLYQTFQAILKSVQCALNTVTKGAQYQYPEKVAMIQAQICECLRTMGDVDRRQFSRDLQILHGGLNAIAIVRLSLDPEGADMNRRLVDDVRFLFADRDASMQVLCDIPADPTVYWPMAAAEPPTVAQAVASPAAPPRFSQATLWQNRQAQPQPQLSSSPMRGAHYS